MDEYNEVTSRMLCGMGTYKDIGLHSPIVGAIIARNVIIKNHISVVAA